jgi:hypothetical protein
MGGGRMSLAPHERLEHTLALETLGAALAEAQRQLRAALRRVDALETQMRREGWTQADLDEIEPNVNH